MRIIIENEGTETTVEIALHSTNILGTSGVWEITLSSDVFGDAQEITVPFDDLATALVALDPYPKED